MRTVTSLHFSPFRSPEAVERRTELAQVQVNEAALTLPCHSPLPLPLSVAPNSAQDRGAGTVRPG
jgi:hypothetical protein